MTKNQKGEAELREWQKEGTRREVAWKWTGRIFAQMMCLEGSQDEEWRKHDEAAVVVVVAENSQTQQQRRKQMKEGEKQMEEEEQE